MTNYSEAFFSMALIHRFMPTEQTRYSVHSPVDCEFSTFVFNGRMYLQLNTTGSNARKLKGKRSQTIQLDQHSASALRKLIDSAFAPTD